MTRHSYLALIVLVTAMADARAIQLAVCGAVSGHAFYHYSQLLPKERAGWTADAITGGTITLTASGEGEFDILFLDARKQIVSARSDGGKVILLRKGDSDMTFLIHYPGSVAEIYTFFKNRDGQAEYVLLQSKGGDGLPIHKSSVMVGKCSELKLIPK